jgi:hypothetical protein
MPRRLWNDGQEIVEQDLQSASPSLEIELYERVIFALMGKQSNCVMGAADFAVSFVNATTVALAPGVGFQFDGTQVDPEPKNRLLYNAASANQTITTPDPTNPRIDLICIKNSRVVIQSGTRNFKNATTLVVAPTSLPLEDDWQTLAAVVTGTPGSSPTVPATPSGYMAVAQVLVAPVSGVANQGSIADVRVRFEKPSSWSSLNPQSANYTMTLDDEIVLANATGGPITIKAPLAASCYDASTGKGKKFKVIKVDATTNVVTVQGSGTDLLGDANIQTIANQGTAIDMVSAGGTQFWLD